MHSFRQRRRRNLAATFAVLVALAVAFFRSEDRLGDASFQSGYFLAAIVLFLLGFHWRKKLTFLPLGRASTWMQLHIYAGLVAIPVFLAHIGFRLPNGPFETFLAAMFVAVTGSGLFGLYITRTYPKRLANVSEEFLFEQIPAHRFRLQQKTRQLVLQAVGEHGTATLADFYSNRLGAYFEQPRGVRFQFLPDTRTRRKLMTELASLQRYLSDAEKRVSDQLFRMIRKKDDLDYQYALQWTLKTWLFVHLALSYGLVFLGIIHVVIVHRFHGGWQ